MVKIMNASLKFTILYLPTRSLRIRGKEVVDITEAEFKSKEFKAREKDFYVLPQPVKGATFTEETAPTPKKKVKLAKADDENS